MSQFYLDFDSIDDDYSPKNYKEDDNEKKVRFHWLAIY